LNGKIIRAVSRTPYDFLQAAPGASFPDLRVSGPSPSRVTRITARNEPFLDSEKF